MTTSVVVYLHVHQPFRVRHYSVFDIGVQHDYFEAGHRHPTNNREILRKVAEKSYLPTNAVLLELLEQYPGFKVSMSITGTVLDQLAAWEPEALASFQRLTETGRVEIVGETYHHSLAFFYSREEFQRQVDMHRELVQRLFGQTPRTFRNTELSYNNDLAQWADEAGYTAILAEGWDPVLGWRSPNHVYRPAHTENIRLLLKNYRLSDDIAFRFGNREWVGWPLSADKFSHWMASDPSATNIDLFMDYETFGEHQWAESGIFEFLRALPGEWLRGEGHDFKTVTEAAESNEPVGFIDAPFTITWADTERDLSAWLGNGPQQTAINAIYSVGDAVLATGDWDLIEDWRRLQTSDHFYYMCTKWFSDGDIHAYFSPYTSPFEAYTNVMNAFHDLRSRLVSRGVTV